MLAIASKGSEGRSKGNSCKASGVQPAVPSMSTGWLTAGSEWTLGRGAGLGLNLTDQAQAQGHGLDSSARFPQLLTPRGTRDWGQSL
jgi:hypothetical protein